MLAYVLLLTVASSPTPQGGTTARGNAVVVPREVVALVRPILDEAEAMRASGQDARTSDLLGQLIRRPAGKAEREALVVLMCFAIGESQEETDAVIALGRSMLPLLKKYERRTPRVEGRSYESILKGSSSKAAAFQGAIRAIEHGWKGTWDNPEG